MGLDFSHTDAHWGYGGFQRFAPRLREVVQAIWPEGEYDREQGLALAEGMERAAAAGERLEFC